MAATKSMVQQRLMTPRILWAAMLMSTLMMPTIMYLTLGSQTTEGPDDVLWIALFLAACIGGALYAYLPAKLRRQQIATLKLETHSVADPDASVIFREASPMKKVFSSPSDVLSAAAGGYFTSFIVGVALAEGIGIYGAVLLALGASPLQALPFTGVAILLIARVFPTRAALLGPIERHFDAVVPD